MSQTMLVSLHVRNLALIEETEVLFQPGLNILTGETGAGKSVILGSVALALGAKADRDMIRTGAEYALIELTFEGSEEVREALRRMDLPAEDNQIILQRRVMPNRSICRINGETVPIRQMRELAGLLIDIHGQHDSQILLQTKRHLEILDAYAEKELPRVKEAYAACASTARFCRKLRKTSWTSRRANGKFPSRSSRGMKLKKQICRQVRTSSWNVITVGW